MPKHREVQKVSSKADVAKDLMRLKGQSRTDLARDDRRGPGSPLGHGMGAKKLKEKGR